jgi:hypothetical protein
MPVNVANLKMLPVPMLPMANWELNVGSEFRVQGD